VCWLHLYGVLCYHQLTTIKLYCCGHPHDEREWKMNMDKCGQQTQSVKTINFLSHHLWMAGPPTKLLLIKLKIQIISSSWTSDCSRNAKISTRILNACDHCHIIHWYYCITSKCKKWLKMSIVNAQKLLQTDISFTAQQRLNNWPHLNIIERRPWNKSTASLKVQYNV